jgi:hypothetical protein
MVLLPDIVHIFFYILRRIFFVLTYVSEVDISGRRQFGTGHVFGDNFATKRLEWLEYAATPPQVNADQQVAQPQDQPNWYQYEQSPIGKEYFYVIG